MILDRIENSRLYHSLGERMQKALQYIATTDFSKMEKGKYLIEGEDLFAMISEYNSKPEAECKLEAHRKYADVQFIVSGEEMMGITFLNEQHPTEEYNEEKDCVFFNEPVSLVKAEQGMFAIFFPHDLHQPCVCVSSPAPVKKVVVKVRV